MICLDMEKIITGLAIERPSVQALLVKRVEGVMGPQRCYDFFHIQHIITHPLIISFIYVNHTHTNSQVIGHSHTCHITLTHIMAYIIMTPYMTHTPYL
jgi:hypothetical protein